MPKYRFWDRDTAIAALQYEARRLGRTPRDRDLRAHTRTCASLKTYVRIFGSLGAAQLAAGLPMNTIGGNKGWRKPKCKRGHARTPENVDRQGHCRKCAAHWAHRKGKGPMLPRNWDPEANARAIAERNRRYWESQGVRFAS